MSTNNKPSSKASETACPIDWDVFPMDQETWDTVSAKLGLSHRHKQIVERVLHGQQRKQIVKDLDSSEGTIGQHFKRIYGYLDTHGCNGLILKVFRLTVAELVEELQWERNRKCHSDK